MGAAGGPLRFQQESLGAVPLTPRALGAGFGAALFTSRTFDVFMRISLAPHTLTLENMPYAVMDADECE